VVSQRNLGRLSKGYLQRASGQQRPAQWLLSQAASSVGICAGDGKCGRSATP